MLFLAGIKPCIITYNTAMDACIRGRDMLRAIGLAKELPLHQLKPDETTSATLLVLIFYNPFFFGEGIAYLLTWIFPTLPNLH